MSKSIHLYPHNSICWQLLNCTCEHNRKVYIALQRVRLNHLCQQKEELQVYEKYCQNKPRSEVLWRQCGDSLFFQVNHTQTHTGTNTRKQAYVHTHMHMHKESTRKETHTHAHAHAHTHTHTYRVIP